MDTQSQTDVRDSKFKVVLLLFLLAVLLGLVTFYFGLRVGKQEIKSCLAQHQISENHVVIMSENFEKERVKNASLNKLLQKKSCVVHKQVTIDWVYINSSRISRGMAEEIVESTMKTKDPLFLLALMKSESSFDPTLLSSKGAAGLGQVMPQHKERLVKAGILEDFREIFEIDIGVRATEFMWDLHVGETNGDVFKGLVNYLGKRDENYTTQTLKDFFFLRELQRMGDEKE